MTWEAVEKLVLLLGGGPSALALIGLSWLYWKKSQRVDHLTDRLFDMSKEQTEAMNELARQIERAGP